MENIRFITNLLGAFSYILFSPIGLLICGFMVGVADNNLKLNLMDQSFAFQFLWSLFNFSALVMPRKTYRATVKTMIHDRFSWLQCFYLICGYLFYSEGTTSTERLNRYIFLFMFAVLSLVLELYLHKKFVKQRMPSL